MFEVYEIGGKHDGCLLKVFDTIEEARAFAAAYEKAYYAELDPTWGGTMILDEAGALWF